MVSLWADSTFSSPLGLWYTFLWYDFLFLYIYTTYISYLSIYQPTNQPSSFSSSPLTIIPFLAFQQALSTSLHFNNSIFSRFSLTLYDDSTVCIYVYVFVCLFLYKILPLFNCIWVGFLLYISVSVSTMCLYMCWVKVFLFFILLNGWMSVLWYFVLLFYSLFCRCCRRHRRRCRSRPTCRSRFRLKYKKTVFLFCLNFFSSIFFLHNTNPST